MSFSKKTIVILSAVTILSLVIILVPRSSPAASAGYPEKTFTSEELSRFDGTKPELPTYLAFDGFVYDITSGRDEFYAPGKPYHYIAGKDATIELRIAGGSIIRRKYSVVGKMVK